VLAAQLRRQAWPEAVRLQLRWAAACDGVGAASSQAKAYLAAVVVWLFAQDAREAWACYQVRLSPPIAVSLGEPLSSGLAEMTTAAMYRGTHASCCRALRSFMTEPAMAWYRRQRDADWALFASRNEPGLRIFGRELATPAQDALGVSAFSTSQEAFAAEDLFDAYRSGDAAAVRAVAAKPLFKTIDNQARAALCT